MPIEEQCKLFLVGCHAIHTATGTEDVISRHDVSNLQEPIVFAYKTKYSRELSDANLSANILHRLNKL